MKIKSSTMDKVFVTFNTIFLVLFVTITLYPVLNTVALSFNDGIDAVRGGIHLWPRIFTLSNYKTVLHQQNILTGAVVSVARTVLGTIFSLVTNALLAYIISRKRFLFRSQLSLFWVITMYVNGGMIPTLVLYRNMNLTNSFWVYVIPGMVSAFNVLVMRTFMEGLPSALEESAMIDGANDFTIFTRIISPLCKPVYATVALFVAVGQWNSWFDAMLYNRMNTQYTTLQYELMKLLSSVMQQSGSATTGGNTATAAGHAGYRAFRRYCGDDASHHSALSLPAKILCIRHDHWQCKRVKSFSCHPPLFSSACNPKSQFGGTIQ